MSVHATQALKRFERSCFAVAITLKQSTSLNAGYSFSALVAPQEDTNKGVIIINAQCTMGFVNKAACQMFGYEVRELRGQNVNVLLPSPYAEQVRPRCFKCERVCCDMGGDICACGYEVQCNS